MRRLIKGLGMLFLLILLSACTQQLLSLEERVPDVPGEVLYHDIIADNIPSDQVKVFGIGLGDTEDDVISLHGKPDHVLSLSFGNILNMEYNLNLSNDTAVLYHVEAGVVRGILLTKNAQSVLHGYTKMNSTLYDLFPVIGMPTLTKDLHLQRRHNYDSLGYEFYTRRKYLDRLYFRYPNQGIEPYGKEVNSSCEDEPTPAVRDGECIVFPRPCIVPDDWTLVTSCEEYSAGNDMADGDNASESNTTASGAGDALTGSTKDNSPPELCIQVITPAVSPDGECIEYPTPCDVPDDWTLVSSCTN